MPNIKILKKWLLLLQIIFKLKAKIIIKPKEGRYANLSDAITLLNWYTCNVGRMAIKKNSQLISGAFVHLVLSINVDNSMTVPITLQIKIGFDKLNGEGNG
jgi:hypothetical protein